MLTITSWVQLHDALRRIDHSGEHGFEGFIAALFQAEIGHHFAVARSGDQTGDASAPTADVVLQGKHYFSTDIGENEVAGEIDKLLRVAPETDVYVLGTTRAHAQLRQRLDSVMRDTGLDIVVAELRPEVSELGALCITFWTAVSGFFDPISPESSAWMATAADAPETKALLGTLRQQLHGMGTMGNVATVARLALQALTRGEGAGARVHNRVLLAQAIARPTVEGALSRWWAKSDSPLAVIEAEEGLGKTWVAARFASDLAEGGEHVVLWFDSEAWRGVGDLGELVSVGLGELFLADAVLCERIKRKVFHRWPQPVLLVLDGANERGRGVPRTSF